MSNLLYHKELTDAQWSRVKILIHDSEPVLELFEGIKLSGKVVLADRAYSCDKVCIPDKAVIHTFDAELYKQRNYRSATDSSRQRKMPE